MGVPAADTGLICGSSTNHLPFPPERMGLEILEERVYQTPYGSSPPFTYWRWQDRRILSCRMHGWRLGVSRGDASRQVFWVLREAGVREVLAEGGVGAVNRLLSPGDLIIPDDYIDLSLRRDVHLDSPTLLIMRRALCPSLRRLLSGVGTGSPFGYVFDRGVYACTDGRHFESPAEVRAIGIWGGDVIGQSLCPEVYLAREIGACYAGIHLVVNYAEGVAEWSHDLLSQFYREKSAAFGEILLKALAQLGSRVECDCQSLRRETLISQYRGVE